MVKHFLRRHLVLDSTEEEAIARGVLEEDGGNKSREPYHEGNRIRGTLEGDR